MNATRIFCWLTLAALIVTGCKGDAQPEPTDLTTPTQAIDPSPLAPLATGTPTATIASPTPLITIPSTVTLSPTPTVPTPTPTPTAAPTVPAATPVPTPLPATPSTNPQYPISSWEGTINLRSYDWESALIETAPDDPVYPYPRLNRDLVGPPAPRTYKTVVLENDYARLTLLPELGGRLYRWLDKPSGREMFYVNPVLKPTHWGARGWWLATGGMEWAFPVDEHGLVEWRPWNYQFTGGANWVGVTLSDQDDRTGLVVEVSVTLEAGRSFFSVRPRIYNPTEVEQPYQFWLNGMFALSPSNRPGPELRFTLPSPVVTVHSTGDGGLPGPGSEMSWPLYDGRDMSRYGNWSGWLGVFARPAAGANLMGAYDAASDMGVARVFPSNVARGAKIFGLAGIGPDTWTDDGSGYVELWGGLTPTFWDYAALPPGGSVGWQERWYSLNGLGGLSYANDEAALWLDPGTGEVQVGALSTTPTAGQLVLWRDGQMATSWTVTLAPGVPFRATHLADGGGVWGLQLLNGSGQTIAVYGSVEE